MEDTDLKIGFIRKMHWPGRKKRETIKTHRWGEKTQLVTIKQAMRGKIKHPGKVRKLAEKHIKEASKKRT